MTCVHAVGDVFDPHLSDTAIETIVHAAAVQHDGQTVLFATKHFIRLGRWLNINDRGRLLPANVGFGVVVTDQETADARIPAIQYAPAPIRFILVEPRGSIDLSEHIGCYHDDDVSGGCYVFEEHVTPYHTHRKRFDLIVVRGERGIDALPMHPDDVRRLRDQSTAADIHFWFDGWGDWIPKSHTSARHPWHAEQIPDTGWRVPVWWPAPSLHRGKPVESEAPKTWPDGARILDWGTMSYKSEWRPQASCWNGHDDDGEGEAYMFRLTAAETGAFLDGVEHPEPSQPTVDEDALAVVRFFRAWREQEAKQPYSMLMPHKNGGRCGEDQGQD